MEISAGDGSLLVDIHYLAQSALTRLLDPHAPDLDPVPPVPLWTELPSQTTFTSYRLPDKLLTISISFPVLPFDA